MRNGLLSPLSPDQEVALRRIALRASIVDTGVASQLVRLSLVERKGRDLRLTPLGQLRYEALPKAPLLVRQRSVHALSGYVEGLIEKAQHRAEVLSAADSSDTVTRPASRGEGQPAEDRELPGFRRPSRQLLDLFDEKHFAARAARSIEKVRRNMKEHLKSHAELCDASLLRISRSRSLLEQSVPLRLPPLAGRGLSAA